MKTRVIEIDPADPGPALAEAAAVLRAGGLVAYPTESFYAVGADATSETAVCRVFALKGRGEKNPLPVIVHDRAVLRRCAREMTSLAHKALDALTPGPVTLVLNASGFLPGALTAGTGKVGIRLPAHDIAAGLARALGGPVTATSANLSGRPGLCSAVEVMESLGGGLDLILDGGKTPGDPPSTIVDVAGDTPVLIREGSVKKSSIEKVLGRLERG